LLLLFVVDLLLEIEVAAVLADLAARNIGMLLFLLEML